MPLGFFDYRFLFILLSLGVLLLYYLGRVFLAEILALFGKFQWPGMGFGFRRAVSALNKADQLVSSQDYEQALNELKKAFFFDSPHDVKQISQIKEHHQNILTRIVLLGEDCHCHFANIAQLEKLLLEHSELQFLLFRANGAYLEAQMRRTTSGKSLPHWGRKEYQDKIRQIETQLKLNRSHLEHEIKLLAQIFRQKPANKEMLQ